MGMFLQEDPQKMKIDELACINAVFGCATARILRSS